MNKEQVLGLIRHILTTAGGALLVSPGILTDEVWVAIVGGVMAVAGVVWSMFFAPEKKLPTV